MAFEMFMYRMRRIAFGSGFGVATLVLLTVMIADRALGRDVLMIVPHDPATVELNRALFEPGDSVAELYGNPLTESVRVILPPADHFLRPEEDPSLVLLTVDKQEGENPLQARTLWFFAKFVVPAFVLLGLVGFLLPRPRYA